MASRLLGTTRRTLPEQLLALPAPGRHNRVNGGEMRLAKRFVSIGECMIEMSGGEDRQYRLGFAGDTLNTAWYARALLPADW